MNLRCDVFLLFLMLHWTKWLPIMQTQNANTAPRVHTALVVQYHIKMCCLGRAVNKQCGGSRCVRYKSSVQSTWPLFTHKTLGMCHRMMDCCFWKLSIIVQFSSPTSLFTPFVLCLKETVALSKSSSVGCLSSLHFYLIWLIRSACVKDLTVHLLNIKAICWC